MTMISTYGHTKLLYGNLEFDDNTTCESSDEVRVIPSLMHINNYFNSHPHRDALALRARWAVASLVSLATGARWLSPVLASK